MSLAKSEAVDCLAGSKKPRCSLPQEACALVGGINCASCNPLSLYTASNASRYQLNVVGVLVAGWERIVLGCRVAG